MELLYLLCSIVSTSLTSFLLSLLLPFQILLRRLFPPPIPASGDETVSFYEGTVWHERRSPIHHSFRYAVRYAFFDLDHASDAPPDHLSADRARQIANTTGPVFLLTIPPSLGYDQNPLSIYYCYDVEESTKQLKKCIAEVTNTPWGERVTFVFNPDSDLVAKPLHVSPLMDMHGNWNIRASCPGDKLYVTIVVQHPDLGDYFIATLKARRVASSFVSDHAVFFLLMPHKVAIWIYWHALKLWWKGVSFIQHPRYSNPSYRDEASFRDIKFRCCPAPTPNQDKPLINVGCDSGLISDRNARTTRFAWRDAKWPWA